MSLSKSKAEYLAKELKKIGITDKSQIKAISLLICEESIMTCQRLKSKFNNGMILDKMQYEIQDIEWVKEAIKKF